MSKKSITTILPVYFLMLFTLLFVNTTDTEAGGYPWRDHAAPYDFLFGNNIDTHQQSKLNNNGELFGFLYITFITGEEIDGIPIAEHCDDSTPPDDCEVGWIIKGKFIGEPNQPTFVFHQDDHPIWLVQSRNDIPQPGSYSHFHPCYW